jgi:exodeoxyribonuclease V beta subunit
VPSVYLSDKDSVTESEEAADVLRWLSAVANPLDGAWHAPPSPPAPPGWNWPNWRACRRTNWQERVEQLKALHIIWQRQGVLAMLRRFIHDLQLPAALLQQPGDARTNLLHLAELLQSASRQLDGEQALIRWLAEQIEGGEGAGDERVLRLESDAELVKVVTVHKSKGLEYPLVYLPFAVTARKVERRNRSFFEFSDTTACARSTWRSPTSAGTGGTARLQEDLRLMYVALTRARHFLWLGVTALAARKAGENTLHESALGYLLTGGAALPSELMMERWQHALPGCDASAANPGCRRAAAVTRLSRWKNARRCWNRKHAAAFERDWSVGSFSSLARRTGPTASIGQALPVPRDARRKICWRRSGHGRRRAEGG